MEIEIASFVAIPDNRWQIRAIVKRVSLTYIEQGIVEIITPKKSCGCGASIKPIDIDQTLYADAVAYGVTKLAWIAEAKIVDIVNSGNLSA